MERQKENGNSIMKLDKNGTLIYQKLKYWKFKNGKKRIKLDENKNRNDFNIKFAMKMAKARKDWIFLPNKIIKMERLRRRMERLLSKINEKNLLLHFTNLERF